MTNDYRNEALDYSIRMWNEVCTWQRRAAQAFAVALVGWLAFFVALFCAIWF